MDLGQLKQSPLTESKGLSAVCNEKNDSSAFSLEAGSHYSLPTDFGALLVQLVRSKRSFCTDEPST